MLKKIINKVKEAVWKRRHQRLVAGYRARLKNPDVSILSSNCTGGLLSHDLGLQFRSPTVNLFLRAEDFIKFCEDLPRYLAVDELVECTDPAVIGHRTYPIAYLDDLTLFLVHYPSVQAAQEKWNERKKRVDPDNIVLLHTDREGMTDALKDRFERLPYRKVMFVHQPDPKHPSCFYLRGYENDGRVGVVTEHLGWSGLRPVDQFDWVGFLNGEDPAAQAAEHPF